MFPADADPNLTIPASASDAFPLRASGKFQQFRVYNRSREDFLSLEVAVFDTTAEPLKRLFDFLIHGSDTGLWLKPYRGVPASQGAKFFDLVYLDEHNHVAWNVDHYPNPQFTVLKREPSSALLLPAHTVFASQVHMGDQLSICALEELESFLRTLADTSPEYSHESSTQVREQAQVIQNGHAQTDSDAHHSSFAKRTSFVARVKQWFLEPPKSARTNRQTLPGLVAYHWSGGKSQPYQLGNISESGFFLLTDERPYPGTLILMTLQKAGSKGEKLGNSIAVYSKVIRWGPDGVGFAFVVMDDEDARRDHHEQGKPASRKSLQEFLRTAL